MQLEKTVTFQSEAAINISRMISDYSRQSSFRTGSIDITLQIANESLLRASTMTGKIKGQQVKNN